MRQKLLPFFSSYFALPRLVSQCGEGKGGEGEELPGERRGRGRGYEKKREEREGATRGKEGKEKGGRGR